MSTIIFTVLFALLNIVIASDNSSKKNMGDKMESVYEFTIKDIKGNDLSLSKYKGKVLLIVNVASKCGYTRQYSGLQNIYEKYKDKGFEILAFPCNDFGGQEPGSNEEIAEFCSVNFNVTFPIFDKVKVLGDDKSPLFKFLTDSIQSNSGDINWNFEKFLISKNGNIVNRFKSSVEPESEKLISQIEEELAR